MRAAIPTEVVAEFLAWFTWLAAFIALESSLRRRFPGIRTLCRIFFLATFAIALVPSLWTLLAARPGNPYLLAEVTHSFGRGVLAQVSIRSLLIARWLAHSGTRFALALAPARPLNAATERSLLGRMTAMNQFLHLTVKNPTRLG